MQQELLRTGTMNPPAFKTQLLKWVGNKQRFGHQIASYFPAEYRTYYEPFLGSGGVLAVVKPHTALGSDGFKPLAEIWITLRSDPQTLTQWYRERYARLDKAIDRVEAYEEVKSSYNANPNPADLLFLSRSCYGGVIRFRLDGYMSTPIGVHKPITPESFEERVNIWSERVQGAGFAHMDFREAMAMAGSGDIIYCDPPYVDTQSILYGAQHFSLVELFHAIEGAKERGAKVALSIDGTKKTGKTRIALDLPVNLFEREVSVNCGYSHLRRFQLGGETMENEVVTDRLLLTW
ncbi:MAG: Dam family site-specific DNA-(adenine-N6)-methyltransferase [Acidimicrobiaceae bacterium]|nr:Dam family site-specific DNA-(adenine-N6)-methyltransferase [Acidimicrobiaceae bacterium]MCY4280408.1 Dam family site-specific DNA-(adenine-N6)-methyltransferase [Acidimicrobiaceae bacterium]MCY4294157.1 Dam family site-specific DNA-(adenine-N6)-methyltransferase [Acidimicrobiaceae bacterium]